MFYQFDYKGSFLYSAVSSPLDRSKRFTLFASPSRPVHSDTNSASPGSILARQQLRAKAKSLTFPPLSMARYSFIQLSEQERQWRDRKCPIFETVTNRDSNPGLLDYESGILPLSYRAPLSSAPMSLHRLRQSSARILWQQWHHLCSYPRLPHLAPCRAYTCFLLTHLPNNGLWRRNPMRLACVEVFSFAPRTRYVLRDYNCCLQFAMKTSATSRVCSQLHDANRTISRISSFIFRHNDVNQNIYLGTR